MTNSDLSSEEIKTEALRLEFDLVGVAPAVSPTGFGALADWLDRGFAGEMGYIERRKAAYSDPDAVMDGVRSIVMLAMNYRTREPAASGPLAGRVSRYAWGARDY